MGKGRVADEPSQQSRGIANAREAHLDADLYQHLAVVLMQLPDDDPGHDVLQCVDTIEYLLPEGKCEDARMPNAACYCGGYYRAYS